ncbi:hypothetical protein BG53_10445 [Paenibacillus darwinianus]|uniref:Uncharacterized protein n=1 Tax=Paenibacillus darwinianus TaxID=1380763 RepID=A0A9W5W603_9BACL|nr:hypothetical protein [Paenibacillus darwinianus]EXX84714.1 hypothetical protein BG52_10115 [Paenibacillus darwinianus]EXX84770.1 hypothetical protein BG53_10445 [Paenibacillus darwinianus]EXX84825.1 hypothetical protein CH50_10720 [Paenibacillus darwinianus]
MDVFELAELHIAQEGMNCKLLFTSAQLAVTTDLGSRLWYIDVNGITQTDVLTRFWTSSDIRIELAAVTAGGRRFEGVGYLHPNVPHNAAAIRGEGALSGY